MGFNKAAKQAERDFNIITNESSNTIITNKGNIEEELMTITSGGPNLNNIESDVMKDGPLIEA